MEHKKAPLSDEEMEGVAGGANISNKRFAYSDVVKFVGGYTCKKRVNGKRCGCETFRVSQCWERGETILYCTQCNENLVATVDELELA